MTHSLHRFGNQDSLKDDFVVFAIAAQTVNAKGMAPKFGEFFDIVKKYNPKNYGDMKTGNSIVPGLDAIENGWRDNSIVHAVFNDEETVAKVLGELKEANTGLSIVVSGIIHNINECCSKNDMKMHTVENSLGVWGNTARLPEQGVLEVSTMCGHGMIAFNLIKKLAEDVRNGSTTAESAARTIGQQCFCGIVNIPRTARLISAMAEK
jgi:hypothetical protein